MLAIQGRLHHALPRGFRLAMPILTEIQAGSHNVAYSLHCWVHVICSKLKTRFNSMSHRLL